LLNEIKCETELRLAKNMAGLNVFYYCCYCCRVACQRSTLSLNCLCHLGSRPHFLHFAFTTCLLPLDSPLLLMLLLHMACLPNSPVIP